MEYIEVLINIVDYFEMILIKIKKKNKKVISMV